MKTTNTYMFHNNFSDYIGCLTRVTNIKEFGSANTNLKVLRKLDIENLKMTWHATSKKRIRFNGEACYYCSEFVQSFALRSLQLSATPSTHYYLNLDIPDLEEFRS